MIHQHTSNNEQKSFLVNLPIELGLLRIVMYYDGTYLPTYAYVTMHKSLKYDESTSSSPFIGSFRFCTTQPYLNPFVIFLVLAACNPKTWN